MQSSNSLDPLCTLGICRTNNALVVHSVTSVCTQNDCFYNFTNNDTTPVVVSLARKRVAEMDTEAAIPFTIFLLSSFAITC